MLRTLGRLAARELGLAHSEPAAVLAPRLPSRYEQADVATVASAVHEEGSGAVPAVAFHAHATATPDPLRFSNASPRMEKASATTGAQTRAGGEARERVQPEGVGEPDRREVPAEITRTVRDTGRDAQSVLRVKIEPPPLESSPRARSDAISPSPLAALRDGAVLPRAGKREMEPVRAALRGQTESRTQPREASALRPLAPAPLPPRAAASAPVAAPVHVTIGRLEIRATTQADPAVAPAARAAPTPSLASYLRRRSDGRRS